MARRCCAIAPLTSTAAVLPPVATPSRAGAHPTRSDLRLPPLQFSTKTAEADTSSELAKKSKETFRKEVSQTFCRQCRQSPDVSVFPSAARLQLHQTKHFAESSLFSPKVLLNENLECVFYACKIYVMHFLSHYSVSKCMNILSHANQSSDLQH